MKVDSKNIKLFPFGGSVTVKTKDEGIGAGIKHKVEDLIGHKDDLPSRDIAGGKGLGLQVMSKIGVEVPPGFTMPTTLCQIYCEHDDLPDHVWDMVKEQIKRIEGDMGRKFGDAKNPLLFSVRSGAAVSMPGMMDTVLNIGLNDRSVQGLAEATKNERFAYDSYRRLLNMYGDVVRGIPHEAFEEKMSALKDTNGATKDVDLTADDLKVLCEQYKMVYAEFDQEFPQDPWAQLVNCIKAVFGSWNTPRAVKYREIHGIKHLVGTAANVQTMVFGNMGDTSGTGVAFSRNPATGENKLFGEYLINAQGEDVVAGIRNAEPIAKLKEVLPDAYDKFLFYVNKIERYFKDMQDVEFTIENGKLWMLQCRNGKRTGQAAIKIAVDLFDEGICDKGEAIQKVEPNHVKQLLHPTFPEEVLNSTAYKSGVITTGLAGGPGAAVGTLVFTTQDAEDAKSHGKNVILARPTTSPEDVGGMWASVGILTSRGGKTSHAAVVARGWGKPCVCGASDLQIDEGNQTLTVKSTNETFNKGDMISMNGSTGEVIRGQMELMTPTVSGELDTLLRWADEQPGVMKVMANADSSPDASQAVDHGAVGIGLCRTEHMFFHPSRLPIVQQWILRNEGLPKVEEFQREDFYGLLEAMNGKPVTIRLLDPPLHEFLPRPDVVTEELAIRLGYDSEDKLLADIEAMHEENPMMGLRGCRLGIVRDELTIMQVRAIMLAAADLVQEGGKPYPRIMIPLVGCVKEFEDQAFTIKQTCDRVIEDTGANVPYEIGTMIEVPRAAILSDKIASVKDKEGKSLCSFFSYGTNDLTQMTMGISRDDSGVFITKYIEKGIWDEDPFQSLDQEGVGFLVKKSASDGQSVNPALSLSVCGEQGGDPKSIEFFYKAGIQYVSCSPFRVPIARLACGQVAARTHPHFVTDTSSHAEACDDTMLHKVLRAVKMEKVPRFPFKL